MALVTVSRSPSSSNSSSTISISETDESDDRLKKSCSSFFAVKGAALFLPHGTDCRPIKKNPVVGDLQIHLQSMFVLLRPEDSITLAVRLESVHDYDYRIRYLVLVSCIGVEDTEENVILGVDIMKRNATVGLVLPVWADTEITLNGDGGFMLKAENQLHIFKPVSVQAMWSALQALNKVCDNARKYTYFSGGLNLTWISFYDSRIQSKTECIKEWNMLPDIESHETVEHKIQKEGEMYRPSAKELTERLIVVKLREVLMNVDIEEVTSKEIRTRLEEVVGNELKEFKGFIDEQMIIILRQMDSPSKILDFLYLGSEWNAGNLGELEYNGIGYILNVTKEIDNFFPGRFNYHNIRLYDVETSDLLKHWEDTHRFISKAKEAGSKALVHCKMGISRSAATVIAFLMKENRWTLEEALKFVKDKRKVINPNRGFRRQLEEYQGILDASNQRHNKLWRSKSESSLSTTSSADSNIHMTDIHFTDLNPADLQPSISEEQPMSPTLDPRRRSWSPNDNTAEALFGTSPEDPSRSAISSPIYLDSPTAHYAGADFEVGEEDSDDEDEDWQEIKIVVPEVPTSPTKMAASQFPPKGSVTQRILSIEGVTTSESNEEGIKDGDDETLHMEAEETVMIPAEDPGKFLIEGAITGESTEDDIADVTTDEPAQEMSASGQLADQEFVDPSDEKEPEVEGATAAFERITDANEDGRKTPVNYPLFLPLAPIDGRYMFPADVDVESVTSSVAVTVDDNDDYIEMANLEDDDEVGEDDSGNATPPAPEQAEADRVLLSPEEMDVFFTPDEGVPPVLEVQSTLQEQEEASGTEECKDVTCEKQLAEDLPSKMDGGDVEEKDDGEINESQASQEMSLDMSQSELNTNNNSSNENSPRREPVASSSPSTKDLLIQSTIKATLSPLEKRNLSILSTPDSPESDGYRTASSDTAETPSPSSYDKDYPKGSVRSRARCYETHNLAVMQMTSPAQKNPNPSHNLTKPKSGESEDLSKSESKLTQDSLDDTPEKQSIPFKEAGSVQKQKKDIEKRLKSESESESSPPMIRSSKVSQDCSEAKVFSKAESSPPPISETEKPFVIPSSQSLGTKGMVSSTQPKISEDNDTSKVQSNVESSPFPSDSSGIHFASPSLQALEKGIVKKLTQQLLSSDTTMTKETLETAQVVTSLASISSSGNNDLQVTPNSDKNQGKSQPVERKDTPDNDRENREKSETLKEETNETSANTSKELEPELASGGVELENTEDEASYSRFGDEKIPLEPGLVKRHTKDYEERSSVEKLKEEVEMMEKTTCPTSVESKAITSSEMSGASGGEEEEVQEEEEEVSAAAAYPDEGSSWRVGDVRRHKKVFEDMKGADGTTLLDTGKPSTVKMSQDSWEGKLTPEELENIKELGKIVLGRGGDSSEEEVGEEELQTLEDETDEPSGDQEEEGKLINVNERIRKLEMGIDKPRPMHVDLKRSSSIARMSNEKCSPSSARRRYERRKVIIRSKSGDGETASSLSINQDTIKEADRESSTSSIEREDILTRESSQESHQELSGLERQRSKSEGEHLKKTSYKETFEESTQDAAINRVLNQAHQALLSKPIPDTASGGAVAQVTKQEYGKPGSSRKRNHGNSHPLAKLKVQSRNHPFYSTM
ncbi:LOW QUALITY PROTEIN: uncharacterized protein [Amphiura filiformis]|uniref:LOW QUALITY PROTEIN: uncharacterized protein n=1 Tax=Amphiura filiformis TaxID=82378 RepID=UPI003B212248